MSGTAIVVDLLETIGLQLDVVADARGHLTQDHYTVGLWSSVYRDLGKACEELRKIPKPMRPPHAMRAIKVFQRYLTGLDIADKYTRAGRSITSDDVMRLVVSTVQFRETLHWILHSHTNREVKQLKVTEFINGLV